MTLGLSLSVSNTIALRITAQPGGCDVLTLCMKAFTVLGPQITMMGRTNLVGGYWPHDGGEPGACVLTGPIGRRC